MCTRRSMKPATSLRPSTLCSSFNSDFSPLPQSVGQSPPYCTPGHSVLDSRPSSSVPKSPANDITREVITNGNREVTIVINTNVNCVIGLNVFGKTEDKVI